MIPFDISRDKTKFDEKGRALPHHGNTILSFMNTEEWPVYQLISDIQKKMKEMSFSQKLAFLPLDSLHMTILPLLKEIDRGTDLWPDYIGEAAPFHLADREIYRRVKEVPAFESVRMKIRGVNITGVHLEPADEESADKLKQYRNTVAEITEIKQKDHEEYNFHVTFAYAITHFNEKEKTEAQNISKELSKESIGRLPELIVPEPRFTVFNDMTKYSTDLSFRRH